MPPRAAPLAYPRRAPGRELAGAISGIHSGLTRRVELREAGLRQAPERLGQRPHGVLSGKREARGRAAHRPQRLSPRWEGLFRFRTVEEAATALDAINTDYERHCRAAREIAATYFDA